MRRWILPLVLGVAVAALLASLGVWQLRRMAEKEQQLAAIQRGIEQPPVPLPAVVDPSMKYRPVVTAGTTTGEEILVLSGTHDLGGGYNVISAFQTAGGRRIMVDRGFITQDDRRKPRPPVSLTVAGNLHWPDEQGSATPEPDLNAGIWFARDVPRMAGFLRTEPVLIVASAVRGDDQGILPIPLDITDIPNNHLSYAIQWFSFAVICLGMTIGLVWRIRRGTR